MSNKEDPDRGKANLHFNLSQYLFFRGVTLPIVFGADLWSVWFKVLKIAPQIIITGSPLIDCEQSLFFFRLSESNARAWERRSRETRQTRAAAREASPVPLSCLSRLAPSVTRVAICVSRVLLDGLQKKERLLVVYPTDHWKRVFLGML